MVRLSQVRGKVGFCGITEIWVPVILLIVIGLCWAHSPLEAISPVVWIDLAHSNIPTAVSASAEESVREYILRTAKQVGVDPTRADWIVKHESRYGKKMRGDGGQSRGYWMISDIYHPEVSTACADDLHCSTDWSLKRMRAGFTNEWATWRFRCRWYENAPECP